MFTYSFFYLKMHRIPWKFSNNFPAVTPRLGRGGVERKREASGANGGGIHRVSCVGIKSLWSRCPFRWWGPALCPTKIVRNNYPYGPNAHFALASCLSDAQLFKQLIVLLNTCKLNIDELKSFSYPWPVNEIRFVRNFRACLTPVIRAWRPTQIRDTSSRNRLTEVYSTLSQPFSRITSYRPPMGKRWS